MFEVKNTFSLVHPKKLIIIDEIFLFVEKFCFWPSSSTDKTRTDMRVSFFIKKTFFAGTANFQHASIR